MPVNLAERGISLQELQGKAAANKAAVGAHEEQAARMQELLGFAYDKGIASQDRHESIRLEAEGTALGEFVRQGKILAERLDEDVTLPEIPLMLLNPDGQQQLTDAKLRPVLVPSFAGLNRAELSRIEDGKPSRFDKVLPRPYLEGVAHGELPVPHTDPYVLFVDAPVDSSPKSKKLTTPLASDMGIQNLAHTPIVEVRSQVRKRSAQALKSLGLDTGEYSIRPVSAREAGLVAVIKDHQKEVVTNTHKKGTDQHVVFGADSIRFTDGTQNGVPPRLTVVGRGLRPDRYLPSRQRQTAKAS